MTLWQEMFNQPSPCVVTTKEFNDAWNWLFSDKETAALKLTIARRHSLALRRLGHVRSSEMSLVGMMRRSEYKSVSNEAMKRRVPTRKSFINSKNIM